MSKEYVYIIGYGSLMNFNSIERTLFNYNENEIQFIKKFNINNLNNLLKKYEKLIRIVNIKNLTRGFFINIKHNNIITKSSSSLAVYKKNNSSINCILFPIPTEKLILFDNRELYYERVEIELNNITLIHGRKIKKNIKIYCYLIKKKYISSPSLDYPILQSYLDLCLNGTLYIDKLLNNKNYELSIQFLKNLKNSKKLKYYINDRIYPYRPYIYQQNFQLIDNLIIKYLIKNIST